MINRSFKAVCLVLVLSGAQADESYPDIEFGGLLDLRAARTDNTTSWLDYGLGKTRYGGEAGDNQVLGRVAEAALLITSHFNWSTSGQLYVKYDTFSCPMQVTCWLTWLHRNLPFLLSY